MQFVCTGAAATPAAVAAAAAPNDKMLCGTKYPVHSIPRFDSMVLGVVLRKIESESVIVNLAF